ncbi:MAG: hypothetical protein AB8G14_16555 [Ilumatobacter sp.]
MFVPATWFADQAFDADSRLAQNGVEGIEFVTEPGTDQASKVVLCGHGAGAVQMSVWGAASGRVEDVTVSVEANLITVDIAPDPARVTEAREDRDAESIVGDGPVISYAEPADSREGMEAEIRGVLELDQGCLYIDSLEADERYPVLWPAGTSWNASDASVRLVSGASVGLGEEVSGVGGYLPADTLAAVARSEAAQALTECVDNEFGEVAVVNNTDDAIGPG